MGMGGLGGMKGDRNPSISAGFLGGWVVAVRGSGDWRGWLQWVESRRSGRFGRDQPLPAFWSFRLMSAVVRLGLFGGVLGGLAMSSASVDAATLKMRFEYGGSTPEPAVIKATADPQFCGQHKLIDESLLVDGETKGIKNIVVYVHTGRGGSKLDDVEPAGNTHELANQNCRFEPHIVIAQKGDTLKVTNPDPVGHNANMNFFNNKAQNPMIPAGGDVEVELKESEPGAIPVECSIHPWMKSYLMVLDHPYAGVSNENGEVVIENLPEGEELKFRVYHESLRIKQYVDKDTGEKEKLKRAMFEVDVKEGENDLGTWVVQ